MRVRMKRRYRGGVVLSKEEFARQLWVKGMLQLEAVEGRMRLGLWEACPGHQTPAFGLLWRPELAGCYSDTISFAGTEKDGDRWYYQVWYCETRSTASEG